LQIFGETSLALIAFDQVLDRTFKALPDIDPYTKKVMNTISHLVGVSIFQPSYIKGW